MLESLFTNNSSLVSSIGLGELLICSSASLLLGLAIALVCKFTSRPSKNFLITITLLPLLVQAVILMVNGNLGTSVAIMGAFGLVKFRSLPGTSREILFVFFAMSVGLATGMGQVWFAILLTLIGSLMIFVLDKIKFLNTNSAYRKLTVVVPEELDYKDVFDEPFHNFTKTAELIKVKTINMGSLYELTYQVELKDFEQSKTFLDEIRMRNSNCKVSLSRELGEGEL